jgi:DNA-binding MarR family transcriptional regulator
VKESLEALQDELQALLMQLHRMRPAQVDLPAGLTSSKMAALMTIRIGSLHAKEVHPSMVAAHMHVTKSALSRTLKSLEGKGFISRERSASDSRVVAIFLTDAATPILEEADQRRKAFVSGMIEFLGEDDLRAMTRTLSKVIEYHRLHGSVELPECGKGHPCA